MLWSLTSIIVFAVSIPNRDFDELQLNYLDEQYETIQVSIPNRDFDELQWQEAETQAVFSFQGAVSRFKGNHSIRGFVWKERQENLKAEIVF
ncbi:hypothetical protein [Nostoc sp.]|uniref:hypothetical protein n=1 Tax=Nostoc sp. TaxID=1180 RepID=UPI003FA551B5